jgi:hypothetical protein
MKKRLAEIDRADRERGVGAYAPRPGRWFRVRRRLDPIVRPARWSVAAVLVIAATLWLIDPNLGGESARDRLRALVTPDEEAFSYAFLLTSRNGDATGWDPCQPIRFVVNPDDAPDDWQDIVESAVSATTEASGFELAYVGTSQARPLDGTDTIRGAPLLISWADAAEVPGLAGHTFGVAYPHPLVLETRSYFVSGVIVINEEASDWTSGPRAEPTAPLVLAHELGHILGLDHVDDRDELMNHSYVGQDGFGPGDRRGLWEVHDVPCR